MCKTKILSSKVTACVLTFLCSSRECQAINPNCARLQFQLSRCWAVHWITLKSWREPCVVKTLRQKHRQETDCVGPEETHILLAERCLSFRGENSVIRNVHRWMKLPHWLFSIALLLSSLSPFLLFLVSFWCIPSPNLAVVVVVVGGAIENLVERVFMVESFVRWRSQRRMLIRQPRLRLIWLAAVTPSSCSQSVSRLFPPLHCSTASFLSLSLFFLFFFNLTPPFTYRTTSSSSGVHLSCIWSHGLLYKSHIERTSKDCFRFSGLKGFPSFHH